MQSLLGADHVIEKWGNGLGVRISAPIAKAAHFSRGLRVRVEVVEGGVLIRTGRKPKMSLAQKLKSFDPVVQGGEVMTAGRVGAEVF